MSQLDPNIADLPYPVETPELPAGQFPE